MRKKQITKKAYHARCVQMRSHKHENKGAGKKSAIPHDYIFKQLLMAFPQEYMELFHPELVAQLDFTEVRFLMQELLVDFIGKRVKILDLLMEVKQKGTKHVVLVLFEPQSYCDKAFAERMFTYSFRIWNANREKGHTLIPIAILIGRATKNLPDTMTIGSFGEEMFTHKYRKVVLWNYNWKEMQHLDNPVAAALLVQMKHGAEERSQMRMAYLKMMHRLKGKVDEARYMLLMAMADMYFQPTKEEDALLFEQLDIEQREEIAMELMPAWKRWGYEEGIEKGIEQGIEQGIEKGMATVIRKLLKKGFTAEELARTVELPVEHIQKIAQSYKKQCIFCICDGMTDKIQ